MPFADQTISFIGAGMMGEAMMKGLLNKGLVSAQQIVASDPHVDRGNELIERYGLRFTTSNIEAAADSNILVIAVKPQVIDRVLHELRGKIDHISLVVSIVAGVTTRKIAGDVLNARVVRAMPNTPGQIGQGITVWTATDEVRGSQREQAQAVLSALGEQICVEEERFLDMATALSGTGPAYVFLFMEALIDAGVHMGFSRRDAEKLVRQTILGSVLYATDSHAHPAELRNQVTSPGGTSAAAIYEMEKGRLRTVLSDAVWAAYRRSVELGSSDKE